MNRDMGKDIVKKVRIFDITKGTFVSDSSKPFVITSLGEKISNVNILGTVIDSYTNENRSFSSITLDDGTGSVKAKVFRDNIEMFKNVKMGESLVVIGRVRQYQGEVHMIADSVRKLPLSEMNYENLRKLEILKRLNERKKIIDNLKLLKQRVEREELRKYAEQNGFDDQILEIIMKEDDIDYKPQVLEVLKKLDEGEGVQIMKIFEQAELPDDIVEKTMNELIDEGYLFEPKPGKFKIIGE